MPYRCLELLGNVFFGAAVAAAMGGKVPLTVELRRSMTVLVSVEEVAALVLVFIPYHRNTNNFKDYCGLFQALFLPVVRAEEFLL